MGGSVKCLYKVCSVTYHRGMSEETTLRIGELSRRVGVSPELLRAWERRYGLLTPTRTAGGFRLYSEADVRRVRRMRHLLEDGLAAAEAARLARAYAQGSATAPRGGSDTGEQSGAPARGDESSAPVWTQRLRAALDAYDEEAAHVAFDQAIALLSLDGLLRDVLGYFADLGERWARGEVSVSQEHYASQLLRGRLLGMARGWGTGRGPAALLACPPGEQHDLPLILFGLALRGRGWRIALTGADTPIDALAAAAEELEPELVVLAATAAERFAPVVDDLAALGRRWPVAVGGRGATESMAERCGARLLSTDPVTAAAEIAGS